MHMAAKKHAREVVKSKGSLRNKSGYTKTLGVFPSENAKWLSGTFLVGFSESFLSKCKNFFSTIKQIVCLRKSFMVYAKREHHRTIGIFDSLGGTLLPEKHKDATRSIWSEVCCLTEKKVTTILGIFAFNKAPDPTKNIGIKHTKH